jgi:hypothetical protein
VALCLGSCAQVARDMGLEEVADIDQRAGVTGTQARPAVLDPFKKYNLVMAANECRFFQMKVPSRWYWKIYLTVVNREENRSGRLVAEIAPSDPAWSSLPDSRFGKTFVLEREGVQAVLGVGNSGPTRVAYFKLCQEGPPLHIAIESQVSSNAELLGPKKPATESKDN